MAHPIEWIPKCANHPEESADSEYTASPGCFSRGRGDCRERRSGEAMLRADSSEKFTDGMKLEFDFLEGRASARP
jgi:hypothetical protein